MTLWAAVLRAASALEAAGLPPDAARFDADLLARHTLGWDTAAWLIRRREDAPPAFTAPFEAAIERRRRREPVAYITGLREFYGRSFAVTSDVLIPRPETELVVEQALKAATALNAAGLHRIRVADVGTGSGCLAITLALERTDLDVTATDVSSGALTVARDNAQRLGARQVTFQEASLLGGDRNSFDLVVANPPYVAERDRNSLEPDVRAFEPAVALFAGDDGLSVVRELLPSAARALVAGGWFVMEFGAGQAAQVRAMASAADLQVEAVVPDLAGIPRVLVARSRAGSI